VREHLGKLGGSLMILGAGAALAYLITSRATGQPSPHLTWPLWPYYLCGAMIVVGLVVYGAAHEMLPWQTRRALKRRAEAAESTLKDVRSESEDVRADLEEAKRAAIAGPAVVKQGEWEALCQPSGPRVVFQLHRRFGDQGAYRDFNTFRCTVTDPDGITTESDGLGIIRQYPPEFPDAPPVRSGRYRSEWKGRISDGKWVDITSGECEADAPAFKLNYYSRPEPKYGDWITAHIIGVTNPDGQPERRVRVTAERMEPYPKKTPPEGTGPSFPYTLPSAKGGDPEAGLLIKPGQEQSWLIGQTGTDDDGKMAVFGFASARNGRWDLGPDESWRFSYRIRCDGMEGEMPFSIVVDSLDGKTIRVRQQG
jgi:hypothetical protein